MPLTERVAFQSDAGKKSVQVPKLIRWKYKLEPTEILKSPEPLKAFRSQRKFPDHDT